MGVRSRTRAILKMTDCTFTYPGAKKPQLTNASCAVSLSSRVGIGEFSILFSRPLSCQKLTRGFLS
jgi:hypothetical protein